MAHIRLVEDVICEESEGTLTCLKNGAFGRLLDAGELNALLDTKPKELVNCVLDEIEARLHERAYPAVFDGRLCLLREDEFTQLPSSMPRIFAV